MAKTNSSVALVLGGGGARGLAHIGVLRWLEEESVPLEAIVGTSIGALIGGLYAAGTGVAAMEAVLKKNDKMTVAKILRPGFSASGIIDNNRVRKFLRSFVGETLIEDLAVPFRAVATDLISGEEIVFDQGPLAEAILASIAIPALFMPVFHEGRYLVDGGLSNPLPVSIARRLSPAPCVAVNVSPKPESVRRHVRKDRNRFPGSFEKWAPAWLSEILQRDRAGSKTVRKAAGEPPGPSIPSLTLMQVVLQSISISTYNLIAQRLKEAKPHVLIAPKVGEFGILEFHEGAEIMKRGYDAAERHRSVLRSILSPS